MSIQVLHDRSNDPIKFEEGIIASASSEYDVHAEKNFLTLTLENGTVIEGFTNYLLEAGRHIKAYCSYDGNTPLMMGFQLFDENGKVTFQASLEPGWNFK